MRKLALAGAALVLLVPLAHAEASQGDTQHQDPTAHLGEMLKDSGYTDIRIAPETYLIRARDADGNPVIISINPGSFSEIKTIGVESLASGNAGPSAPDKYVQIPKADELSSKIVGLDIYNNSNQDIGQIKDIALDPQGQAVAYIVSVGGFLTTSRYAPGQSTSATMRPRRNGAQRWMRLLASSRPPRSSGIAAAGTPT